MSKKMRYAFWLSCIIGLLSGFGIGTIIYNGYELLFFLGAVGLAIMLYVVGNINLKEI